MDARYQRNIPALSEEECALLHQKRVLVVGCGGLGGYLVELLARLGVGLIRVVDGDVFEESNLNRQLYSQVSLLGKSKAQAAADRVAAINPDVKTQAIHAWFDQSNGDELVAGCDAVLDGLDSGSTRKLLASVCDRAGVPLIHGAIRGWEVQAAISMPGDGLMERLYRGEDTTPDNSALSFTPAMCASMQTALCVRLLVGRGVMTGTLFCADLLHDVFLPYPV